MKICVAGLAISDGFDILDDLVLDLHVALVALNLILVYMFCVHEIRIVILLQSFPFPMALITVFPGDFSISNDCIAVTFVASEISIENKGVVESCGFAIDQSFFCVAMGAIVNLGIVCTYLEMADETGAFGNGNVLSLDYLGVTACALKAFSPFKVFEMDFVVEGNILKTNLSF
jgi:hypothetical protein